jgi:hypothetical protein
MKFQPTPIEPVKRPTIHDAKLLGGLEDGDLLVAVGGVAFSFHRLPDGDWTGGGAMTIGRGWEIDERWLTAARGVAAEALRAAIMAGGEPGEEPVETVRCPECERLLSSAALVRAIEVASISCGPAHVVAFSDGFEVIFGPHGITTSQREAGGG